MQKNNQPNFISPIQVPDSQQSSNKFISEVSNTANLWTESRESVEPASLIKFNRKAWEYYNPGQVANYDQGVRRSENFSYDSKVASNCLYILLKSYIELLKCVYRDNEKSLSDIKFMLEMLDTIHNNINHLIEKDKVQVNNQAILSEMHGMMIGSISNKIKPNNETTNE